MVRTLSSSAGPGFELPITPMLDMAFQLLAFLIFTFQPQTLTEGKVEFTLPRQPGGCQGYYPVPDPVEELAQEPTAQREWPAVTECLGARPQQFPRVDRRALVQQQMEVAPAPQRLLEGVGDQKLVQRRADARIRVPVDRLGD